LNNIVTLKFGLEVTQGHWNWLLVPFESLGAVSYSPSIVTMTVPCIISQIKRDIGRKSSVFIARQHTDARYFIYWIRN